MFTNVTRTVEQMKEFGKSSRIDIIKNPKTGKLFFTCGSVRGFVSSLKPLAEITKDPLFYETEVDEEHSSKINPIGTKSWMLSTASHNNVEVTL